MKVLCVVGARPNLVKIAPILHAFDRRRANRPDLETILVHTGQHYDASLTESFFADLAIATPDVNLGVGSGGHAEQTARVLLAFEPVLGSCRPDMVVVVGDVNSTLACALTAAKLGISVAHVEAGLRSWDRTMPEEINRILTDALSDLCFTTCAEADENLAREGIAGEKIFFVGNVMIDTLLSQRPIARRPSFVEGLGLPRRGYAVLTVHRPSNVDRRADALGLLHVVDAVRRRMPVVFPVHPRSRARFTEHDLWARLAELKGVHVVEPLGYSEFVWLVDHAGVVLTDSGGIQEETTFLGVPCLTLRRNTERAITIKEGTNRLVGMAPDAIETALEEIQADRWPTGRVPDLWDGRAAERIADTVIRFLSGRTSAA